VGGAVRDECLGLAVQDRDWVVVGSSPEVMVAAGYLPVGRDFPVFLHPISKEEYALARTERKTARGYAGFAFQADEQVTLEQDLARRDLTINAMAKRQQASARDPELYIDPYGGRQDLRDKLFRHVSAAFVEDPVRILRVARFAARFTDFSVAPETLQLMQQMVNDGEVDALVAERVWQELSKGLMAAQPSRMFAVLREAGALKKLLPELDRLWGVPQTPVHHPEVDTGVHVMMVLDQAARAQASLAVRFACLCHDLGKGTTPPDQWPRHLGHEQRSLALLRQVCQRWRVPTECRELAEVVAKEHGHIHRSPALSALALVRLLERCDAFRKPQRFEEVLLACECDARGRLGFEAHAYAAAPLLRQVLRLTQGVDTAQIAAQAAAQGLQGEKIAAAIQAARAQVLRQAQIGEQAAADD
jgi:tRNA nucleotidyltransferase (CCA-adding enzyme)